jgi:hypothetical protein
LNSWDIAKDGGQKAGAMRTRRVETLGETYPGWLIDLIAGRTPEDRFNLLYWDGQELVAGESITWIARDGSEQCVYYARKVDPSIGQIIYLPKDAAPYDSTGDLLNALSSTIKQFSGLEDAEASLLGYAVLASWLIDFTQVPVSLALIGPTSPERRQLLRLLHCLLRRALVVGEASLAGICSLPMEIASTLLVERCEPTTPFLRFLEATNSRDSNVIVKGRILNACCGKVLCSEQSWSGTVPGWPLLEIFLPEFPGALPVLTLAEWQRIAAEFQPKLEMFRLKNFVLARDSATDFPDIPAAARELAGCLGACVADDKVLQGELGDLLKKQFLSVQSQSEREVHVAVIQALLALSKDEKRASAGVAEITFRVNRILENNGELLVLAPRAVGSVLRTLGFSTQRLGAAGRGITLLNSVKQRIHDLAIRDAMPGNGRNPLKVTGLPQQPDGKQKQPPVQPNQVPSPPSTELEEIGSPRWVETAEDRRFIDELKKDLQL